jgi:hypothetical protein
VEGEAAGGDGSWVGIWISLDKRSTVVGSRAAGKSLRSSVRLPDSRGAVESRVGCRSWAVAGGGRGFRGVNKGSWVLLAGFFLLLLGVLVGGARGRMEVRPAEAEAEAGRRLRDLGPWT